MNYPPQSSKPQLQLQAMFRHNLRSASKTTLFSALLVVATTSSLSALELHVSPTGKDTAAGSKDAPFLTLNHTRDQIRKSPALGKEPITVNLAAGTYYLPEALRLTAADSGTADAPVTYQGTASEDGNNVILSGARPLELSWKAYQNGIYQATTPAGLSIDQLYVNGELEHMARFPNYDPKITVYNGYAADAFSPERAANWKNPAGGYIHAIHAHRWGGYHYRITGKNEKNEVQYEGGWQNNRQMGMHKSHRFVENIFEELDAAREWFHDSQTNTLYYFPAEGTDLKNAKIETAVLPHLVEVLGSQQNPAKHIHFKGISFRQTARTFMETKEPLLRSDWTIYRGGAVFFQGC